MGCCRWGNDTDRVPTVPPPRPTADTGDVLTTRRAAAERDLVAATGGAALCRVDGDLVGTVKYQEGRLAAVAELQRAVRAQPGDPLASTPSGPREGVADVWHVQIDIDRPADEVWAVLADYGRDADWRREVTTMVPEPAGPARVGTRTHETGRLLGSPFETEGRVVEAADRWFRWEARGDGSRACGTRGVQELGADRCRVVLGYDVALTVAQRVLNPLFVAAFRRAARRNLRTLAALVHVPAPEPVAAG